MHIKPIPLAGAVFGLTAAPVAAEVVDQAEDHFVTRAVAVVEADTTATWLALISPARWWSSEHTWSADAANLTLTPQAGGCFCERIPEVDEPDRFTLEGSVEHMRVIQAYPEVALRMSGALGPLQSEPVTGILTIAISEVEEGTQIVWEYNVGGPMRYDVGSIARAVDGVMTLQLTGLAESLGVVMAPAEFEAEIPEEPEAPQDSVEDAIQIDPEDVIDEGGEGEDAGEPTDEDSGDEEAAPTAVDEAFSDLSGS